jgi:hypothetical protein
MISYVKNRVVVNAYLSYLLIMQRRYYGYSAAVAAEYPVGFNVIT